MFEDLKNNISGLFQSENLPSIPTEISMPEVSFSWINSEMVLISLMIIGFALCIWMGAILVLTLQEANRPLKDHFKKKKPKLRFAIPQDL